MNGSKLLDTNIIVGLLNGDPRITSRHYAGDDVVLSSVAVGELYFGALNSGHVRQNLERLEDFINDNLVLPCDVETARHYGEVRLALQRKGRPIPENDIWIAAIARQHDLIMVTRDQHFREIENLQIETW